jgi:hypothetical protein
MIDPVRTSAVTPITANVAGTDSVRGPAPQLAYVAKPQPAEAPPSPSLPRLLELVSDLSSAPAPVDHAKIAQIRRAIADHNYKIDLNALARSIVYFDPKD